MSAHIVNVTATTFLQDVVEKSRTTPVLVDFWAEWCGPCKQLMPTLQRIADEYAGRFILAKVDTDQEQALSAQLGVRSLPTVVLFKDAQVVDHFVGAAPEAQVRQMLERHLPAPTRSPTQIARELIDARNFAGARSHLAEALAKEPGNIELQCELGEVDALSGDLDSAKQMLATVQAREPTSVPTKRLAAVIEFSDVMLAHPDAAIIRQQLDSDAGNLEARHALAVHQLLAGDYGAALQDWLQMMRTDRKFKDDLARKSLVQAFELLGNDDRLVAQTRREMARMLF